MQNGTLKSTITWFMILAGIIGLYIDFKWNWPMITTQDKVYFYTVGLVSLGVLGLSVWELFASVGRFTADAKGLLFPDKTFISWQEIAALRLEKEVAVSGRVRHLLHVSFHGSRPVYSWDLSAQNFDVMEVLMEIEAVLPIGVKMEKA